MNIWNKENLDEALSMRKSGKTYREIGEYFHITLNRARQVVMQAQRKPFPPRWYEEVGLSPKAIREIQKMNINSKEDCLKLVSSNLRIKRGVILDPRHYEEDEAKYWPKFHTDIVNEIRKWLGIEPLKIPQRIFTQSQIERMIKILTILGYAITKSERS